MADDSNSQSDLAQLVSDCGKSGVKTGIQHNGQFTTLSFSMPMRMSEGPDVLWNAAFYKGSFQGYKRNWMTHSYGVRHFYCTALTCQEELRTYVIVQEFIEKKPTFIHLEAGILPLEAIAEDAKERFGLDSLLRLHRKTLYPCTAEAVYEFNDYLALPGESHLLPVSLIPFYPDATARIDINQPDIYPETHEIEDLQAAIFSSTLPCEYEGRLFSISSTERTLGLIISQESGTERYVMLKRIDKSLFGKVLAAAESDTGWLSLPRDAGRELLRYERDSPISQAYLRN